MSELCRRQIIRQQQIMKKSALTVLIALLPLAAIAQTPSINEDGKKIEKEKMETKDYLPEVHGTIRAKYEYQTTMGAGRFEVRNARVSVTGNVLPSVAYKAEIDLSDEGQIKMLDAYARLFPTKGLTVTAGQMRVPFTIDAHRSPHQQYFPNRSFIAKQVGNVRGRGIHSRIYPAYRCTYHRGRRTFQRFRTDQPERMAQGSELLRQSPVSLHQRTEPDTKRAEYPTGRSTHAVL